MSGAELCRRMGGHDWKQIGISKQCRTCGITVRWRQGGGSTGKTTDDLARENEVDRNNGRPERNR